MTETGRARGRPTWRSPVTGGAACWRAHIALIRIHGIAPGPAGAMIAKDFPLAKDLHQIRCFYFAIM
jgi:hypothetical protein